MHPRWTALLAALIASNACIESRRYQGPGSGGDSAGPCSVDEAGRAPEGCATTSAIAAGHRFNCGILAGGGVYCWGSDDEGQVSQAPESGDFISVAAGLRHACALRADNTLECWGSNQEQQAPRRPSPEEYGRFRSVACGEDFTCGVRLDGSPLCFGSSTGGKLEVPGGTYSFIATGTDTACGVRSDGSLACWGNSESPIVRDMPEGSFTTVSVGREHACAINRARNIACWGRGEGGDGTGITRTDVRAGEYLKVSAGFFHTAAITQGDHFTCFADPDADRQCMTVAYVVGVWHEVAAGPVHTCVLGRPEDSASEGTVECFGADTGAVSPTGRRFKVP